MLQADLFGASYDQRFLNKFLGNMIKDPVVAIIELIANAYDAGALNVHIKWPTSREASNPKFEIKDDGRGLLSNEFQQIWGKLNYDKLANQSSIIDVFDENGVFLEKRHVYGKNGKGRLSAFCFNDKYHVISSKNNELFECEVLRSLTEDTPFILSPSLSKETNEKNGLTISSDIKNISSLIDVQELRKEVSARFISRPTFKIYINGAQLTLQDIPKDCIIEKHVQFRDHTILIRLIDTHKVDQSTKQRGVAWWVHNRLVGDINWSFLKSYEEFDRRSTSAKKYNLIIEADCLHALNLVLPDWEGFDIQNDIWTEFEEVMIPAIRELMNEPILKEAKLKADSALRNVRNETKDLGLLSKSKLISFVDQTVQLCPKLNESTLNQLANILIKLEKSSNKYNLIQKLDSYTESDLDNLYSILDDWGLDMAKVVLDEIESRLKTIAEFESRIKVVNVKEVQELQTLFNTGLWMFGANFEAIDFSSNKGMSSVFKNLFNIKKRGSRNRPDYVILPEAFSRPKFDDESHEEIGIDHVVILDLKTTGLELGSNEKDQIWKYVKELESKGAITKQTKVHGFILGDKIESSENFPRKEWDDKVVITPLLYSTLLSRAKNRMLKLSDKVSSAPILKKHIQCEQQRLSEIYDQDLAI